MNIREAVDYLASHGYECSASTVRNLVRAGKLPCYRPGVTNKGRMVFRVDRLDEFLRQAEWGPAAEAQPDPPAPKRAAKPKTEKPKKDVWREKYRKVVQS